MTSSNRTCEYVLDPDDPDRVREEILNEDGVWTCPHEREDFYGTSKGKIGLCLFHAPKNKKDNKLVMEKLSEKIENSAQQSKLEFLGAKFGKVKLSELSSVDDSIDFSQAQFADVEINRCEFNQSVYFHQSQFSGQVVFENNTFEKHISFYSATFLENTTFKNNLFVEGGSFIDVTFNDEVNFRLSEFDDSAGFTDAEFLGKALFGGQWVDSYVDSDDIPSLATDFRGMARFDETEFNGRTDFSWTSFDNGVDFSETRMNDATFKNSDLSGAIFSNSKLHNVNFESSLLNRSSLYDADLRGAKLLGALLGDSQINEGTQFLGNPKNESNDNNTVWDTIKEIRESDYCVYDPDYKGETNNHTSHSIDDAKAVYRKIEELARSSARPELLSKCFVRRQDLQQKQYWEERKKADNRLESLISIIRGSRAKVARETLLYGESPWRVITGSTFSIILIALLYPLDEWLQPAGGEPITYSRILDGEPGLLFESLYFSTLTFTTLGMGDYEPMGLGQVLATINTTIGAVLIALLVFVLGRRAAR